MNECTCTIICFFSFSSLSRVVLSWRNFNALATPIVIYVGEPISMGGSNPSTLKQLARVLPPGSRNTTTTCRGHSAPPH